MEVKEGDIFITKLERNFYGAFKILKRGKSFFDEMMDDLFMIAVLDYVHIKKPQLTDKQLDNILIQNRFFWNNQLCVNFFTTNPKYNDFHKNYEYLGNKPLTELEKSIDFKLGDGREGVKGGYSLVGVFEQYIPNNAFLEWRWENEREQFKKEIAEREEKSRIEREKQRKKGMKPKKMLPDDEFWEVIEKINWDSDDDDERMKPAIEFLANKKVNEIKQFQENFAYKLYQLDTKEHAKNIGEDAYKEDDKDAYFSVDCFLYVRCCVVANGKDYFEKVLKNPQKMPKDGDFEPLLYIAEYAYEMRMNKEFEYETGCDYETFSNYKGWE